MKRILHVIAAMPVGGAENVLLTTLKNLDPNQYQSIVCCIQNKGILGIEVERFGIRLIELHKLKKGGFDASITEELVRIIRENHIDLVHAHLYHANLYARLAAKETSTPSVITIHNTYAKRKWHRQWINWYLARYTSRILAVSDAIRNDVIRFDHVAEDKVVTVLNGIDLKRSQSDLSKSQARQNLELPEAAQVLVVIGRLVEQKGHGVLLEAVALLIRHMSKPLRLLVVGDGPLRGELEAQADTLGIRQYITFLGTRTDIGDILKTADIYVMPSLWEGLGLALLEAMAAGVPVVASRVGGMLEVLAEGKYGYLVPPGDATQLAQKLIELLNNERLCNRLVKPAKTRVMDFEAGKMLESIQAQYRSVLKA